MSNNRAIVLAAMLIAATAVGCEGLTVMRRSHVACHAAALSWILGRKLTINPVTEEFVGDDDANHMRFRQPRVWA